MNKIFGYKWEDIQAMQNGVHTRPTVDVSKPSKGAATQQDRDMLAKHGTQGLRDNGMWGVLDRLEIL